MNVLLDIEENGFIVDYNNDDDDDGDDKVRKKHIYVDNC